MRPNVHHIFLNGSLNINLYNGTLTESERCLWENDIWMEIWSIKINSVREEEYNSFQGMENSISKGPVVGNVVEIWKKDSVNLTQRAGKECRGVSVSQSFMCT